MSEPTIHVAVEAERNLGDHGRMEYLPMTVDPETTLRELVDLAGKRNGNYVSMGSPDWMRLGNDRIIVMVEATDE
jgi:hypothetical protein